MSQLPNTTTSFYAMGQRLFEMKAYTAAIRALKIAVERSEHTPDAHELLGKCYTELDMPESAQLSFEKAKAQAFNMA